MACKSIACTASAQTQVNAIPGAQCLLYENKQPTSLNYLADSGRLCSVCVIFLTVIIIFLVLAYAFWDLIQCSY